MESERVKLKKDGLWYVQRRLNLLWIIPTPIWMDYSIVYNDLVLGEIIETASFETEEDAIKWWKDEN